jgi:hypothetical protein
MQVLSVFNPNSTYALGISHLFTTAQWLMAGILLLVAFLVLYRESSKSTEQLLPLSFLT